MKEKIVYQLQLDGTRELAALSAMMLIATGTVGMSKFKIALGIATAETVPYEYISVCEKINALAGAGNANLAAL